MNSQLRLIFLYLPVLMISLWALWKWEQIVSVRGNLVDSLPQGQYTILKKSCLVSDIEFDFTTEEWKKNIPSVGIGTFGLYRNLQDRLMIIGSKTKSEILNSDECKLLVERTIIKNAQGILATGGSYRAQYFPNDCHFTYVVGDEVMVAKQDNSKAALSSENIEEFEIFQYDYDKFHIYDKHFNDHTGVGCSSSDKLITTVQLKL